ncbi:hypothetical protein ACE6H2_027953 [Prunus campanulata]
MLKEINLDHNNFNGPVPVAIFNMSSLTTLTLFWNSLSGGLPDNICQHLPNLQVVNLGRNKFEGPLPSKLWQCRQLLKLRLFENNFSGSIPKNIGNLTKLTVIYLHSNNLTGTIPDEIGDLQNLEFLAIEDNNLNGPIPSSIFNISTIIEVELGQNQLSDNLAYLYLGSNQLSGSIPSCLGNLAAFLRYLSLESNLLTSTIPSTFWRLSYILHVNLSSNSLIGSLSQDIGKLKVVIDVDLSNNHLSGLIPSTIRDLLDLATLSLENNNLEGPIPSSFHYLLSLQLLDLSRNNLSGEIPKSLEALSVLKYLDLSFNRLQGEIPTGGPFQNFSAQSFVSNYALCGAPRFHEKECGSSNRGYLVVSTSLEKSFTTRTSLDKWLYSQNYSLNILQRMSIMIDVASALEYLHDGYSAPIVHCDMKPSNILLDDDMVAHVADFGIAKLLEYGMEGIVSRRGDVYSFGIVVMETFTRRKPTDEMFVGEMNLKQWIANSLLLPDAKIDEVVDANLLGIGTEQEDDDHVRKRDCLSAIMRLALACCTESPEERISMKEAIATLNKIKRKFFKDAVAGRVVLNRPLVQRFT